MSWLKLIVETDQEQAGPVSDLLMELGAGSATLLDAQDEPVLEPLPGEVRLWSRTQVLGMFPADFDTAPVVRALRAALADPDLNPTIEILEDRDWIRAWMDHFRPMQFGSRLWIIPTGLDAPAEAMAASQTRLTLDPGLAFGTGTHPTTRLCLSWLDQAELDGRTLLDFGCGSGILAIAALKLGAQSALGIDIDPQALTATRSNAQLNAVNEKLRLGDSDDAMRQDERFDIVIANILAGPLQALAPRLAESCRNAGHLVLSGVLEGQAESLAEHYSAWFDMSPIVVDDGWSLLHGIRSSKASR